MIYTTYFAKIKQLPPNVIPIAICGKVPANFKGIQYKKLAPKYDFFIKWKETHDNDYYIKCFNEQVLANLNAENIVKQIKQIAGIKDGNKTFALVCYEAPHDFCHRHLVAKWLNENGFETQEFGI